MRYELIEASRVFDYQGHGVAIRVRSPGHVDVNDKASEIAFTGVAERAGKLFAALDGLAGPARHAAQLAGAERAIAGLRRDLERVRLDRSEALDQLEGEPLLARIAELKTKEDALSKRIEAAEAGIVDVRERSEVSDLDLRNALQRSISEAIDGRRVELERRLQEAREKLLEALAPHLTRIFELEGALTYPNDFRRQFERSIERTVEGKLPPDLLAAVRRAKVKFEPSKPAMSAPAGSSGR